MSLTQMHAQSLAEFEARRFCSISDAARYLDISYSGMRALLAEQKIRSQYPGKHRKVVVTSLLEYAENSPIDPPNGGA